MDEDVKSPRAFRTISEVSEEIGVPQHVLRFWESKFPAIKPLKRGGNRRYYRPDDVQLLRVINRLLYTDGYTIRGVQKLLAERGVKGLLADEIGTPAASAVSAAPAAEPAPARSAVANLFDPQIEATVEAAEAAEAGPALSADDLAELRAVRALLADGLARARAA